MIRKSLLATIAILGLCTSGFAAPDSKTSVAVVNFNNCMTESKIGKQETASFESLKEQMASLLADTEKQINQLAAEFNDPVIMDALTPEEEEKKKMEFSKLSEEMNRYQNQYYQVLQQANMKVIQTLGAAVQEASEKVAKEKKLPMVINKEACFFFTPTMDVTNFVIAEMDKSFELKNAKVADNQTDKQIVEASKAQAKKTESPKTK